MTINDLLPELALGEDSRRQFKRDVTNADSLAAEMAAMANADGGVIYIGVTDEGVPVGLGRSDTARINQLIGNAAVQHVRSPLTVRTENIWVDDERVLIALTIPTGLDKPYFDRHGVIWLKIGADKRRVYNKEELQRIFQSASLFHGDESPTTAGVEKLDKLRFREFLEDRYDEPWPESPQDLVRLLRNMNLTGENGMLNLAGVLLFAERPELIKPQFVIKAARPLGLVVHADEYLDMEDITGAFPKMCEGAIWFVMRNLHKIQAGRGFNSPGIPEIPKAVFEELLVNAMVHRDYLISAPIRLFVFDDRIEIISPGRLPNNLTVANIKAGISNIRNPILASFTAKGLLPYRGLGSGIKRALSHWHDIDFTDDREGNLFTAVVHRKALHEARKR